MYETHAELDALQDLLDRSVARATGHLRAIITPEHALQARDVVELMTGMKVLAAATVTATGEPRISCMDGHFLHGTWSFSTAGDAAKARHLQARPVISVAHVDGEQLALFSHGHAGLLEQGTGRFDETVAHWTRHYGSNPLDWGPDIRLYDYRAHWMAGYAFDRDRLLAERLGRRGGRLG